MLGYGSLVGARYAGERFAARGNCFDTGSVTLSTPFAGSGRCWAPRNLVNCVYELLPTLKALRHKSAAWLGNRSRQ